MPFPNAIPFGTGFDLNEEDKNDQKFIENFFSDEENPHMQRLRQSAIERYRPNVLAEKLRTRISTLDEKIEDASKISSKFTDLSLSKDVIISFFGYDDNGDKLDADSPAVFDLNGNMLYNTVRTTWYDSVDHLKDILASRNKSYYQIAWIESLFGKNLKIYLKKN